jgi:hypothetical protein
LINKGRDKVKIILLLLITIGKISFASIGYGAGYGISGFNYPIDNNRKFLHNLYFEINNSYKISDSEKLILSSGFSSYRRQSRLYLNEVELHTLLQKKITSSEHVGFGFQFAYLINEKIEDIRLSGLGFGINLNYERKISKTISLHLQLQSTGYHVKSNEKTKRFTSKTIRSYLTYSI